MPAVEVTNLPITETINASPVQLRSGASQAFLLATRAQETAFALPHNPAAFLLASGSPSNSERLRVIPSEPTTYVSISLRVARVADTNFPVPTANPSGRLYGFFPFESHQRDSLDLTASGYSQSTFAKTDGIWLPLALDDGTYDIEADMTSADVLRQSNSAVGTNAITYVSRPVNVRRRGARKLLFVPTVSGATWTPVPSDAQWLAVFWS